MLEIESFAVLLVEDNAIDRRVLVRDLRRYTDADFVVSTAASLAECLGALNSQHFDSVLLDLSLPDSAGLKTVEAVLDTAQDCPVIVLTGLGDPTLAVAAVAAGAQDYLLKGQVDHETVGRSIRYTVARHRSEQQLRAAHAHLDVLRERDRIARDLHDTVIQQLFATGMGLQSLAGRIEDDGVRAMIASTITEIDAGIHQLREAVFDLQSHGASSGLVVEIQELIEARSDALNLNSEVFVHPRLDLVPTPIGEDLRATVTEALANVAKHADASKVTVNVAIDGETVRLEVVDDGRGHQLPAARTTGNDGGSAERRHTGHGLANMAERAARHGGHFALNHRPNGGTALVWQVALD